LCQKVYANAMVWVKGQADKFVIKEIGAVTIGSAFKVKAGSDAIYRAYTFRAQGQYWAGRAPPSNNPPPNMAAANFVVITNGEGCSLNETAVATVLINQ